MKKLIEIVFLCSVFFNSCTYNDDIIERSDIQRIYVLAIDDYNNVAIAVGDGYGQKFDYIEIISYRDKMFTGIHWRDIPYMKYITEYFIKETYELNGEFYVILTTGINESGNYRIVRNPRIENVHLVRSK